MGAKAAPSLVAQAAKVEVPVPFLNAFLRFPSSSGWQPSSTSGCIMIDSLKFHEYAFTLMSPRIERRQPPSFNEFRKQRFDKNLVLRDGEEEREITLTFDLYNEDDE